MRWLTCTFLWVKKHSHSRHFGRVLWIMPKKDKCAAYRPNTIVSYLPPYQPSSPCPWEALYTSGTTFEFHLVHEYSHELPEIRSRFLVEIGTKSFTHHHHAEPAESSQQQSGRGCRPQRSKQGKQKPPPHQTTTPSKTAWPSEHITSERERASSIKAHRPHVA